MLHNSLNNSFSGLFDPFICSKLIIWIFMLFIFMRIQQFLPFFWDLKRLCFIRVGREELKPCTKRPFEAFLNQNLLWRGLFFIYKEWSINNMKICYITIEFSKSLSHVGKRICVIIEAMKTQYPQFRCLFSIHNIYRFSSLFKLRILLLFVIL